MIIATHDGSFHADETLACAILSYVYDKPQIIRSRDPKLLETADLIIDVSGINDHKHFDHHSNEFNLKRDNGINYATAGLMWLKFGITYLKKIVSDHFTVEQHFEINDAIYQAAFERIDREVMYMVDLNDNGQLNSYIRDICKPRTPEQYELMEQLNEFYQCAPDIPYLVAMQNLPNISGAEQNKAFLNTVKFLRQIMINIAINAINTEMGIAKVLEIYDGGELLIMHEKLPWTQAVLAHFDTFSPCQLAIYPDRKRGWRIQALPYSKAERFRNKLLAPKSWRGLDAQDLDEATGLKDTIFVHRSGFTGGALEFDTIMQMAQLWLKQGEPGYL